MGLASFDLANSDASIYVIPLHYSPILILNIIKKLIRFYKFKKVKDFRPHPNTNRCSHFKAGRSVSAHFLKIVGFHPACFFLILAG